MKKTVIILSLSQDFFLFLGFHLLTFSSHSHVFILALLNLTLPIICLAFLSFFNFFSFLILFGSVG